jgi:serine/threonine protein kinase
MRRLQIIMFDIKSTNVVLDRAGLVAKVCDFGLSKIMAGSHTQNTYVSLPPFSPLFLQLPRENS